MMTSKINIEKKGKMGEVAIILAAGVGKRLRSFDLPKCLLSFSGRSLLERHLRTLNGLGIDEVHITGGYRIEVLTDELHRIGYSARLLHERDTRGSMKSLLEHASLLRSGCSVVLMDADVLFAPKILQMLVKSEYSNCLLVDMHSVDDEAVKVCFKDGVIVDFHKRPEQAYDRCGESVGFFKLSPVMAAALADRCERYAAEGLLHLDYEVPLRDVLIEHSAAFGVEDITGLPWIEIDFDEDVERAIREILPRLESELVTHKLETETGSNPMANAIGNDFAGVYHEQVAHFQQHGWVSIRGFFSSVEVRQLQAWADELVALPQRPGEHMVYSEQSLLDTGTHVVQRIEYFCRVHAGFNELLNHGCLALAAAQLLGESVCLFKEKINFKYPGGGGFKAHQDQQAGWSRYAPIFLSALVSIDDATIENGCLEIEHGRPERLRGLIGEEWKPLNDDPGFSFRYQPIPTSPGDVVFFDSYVPHRSNPNLTDSPRRVLYATYNGSSHGNHREEYFRNKRASFPPDCEREPGKVYTFRV